MIAKLHSLKAAATIALRDAFTQPAYWLPALVLMSPALVLQLAAPTYLRTRLAPSAWTVAAGALLIVWLAQVALPAVCALIHRRRRRLPAAMDLALARLSIGIGTRVTLGLIAGVVPGLWLQAHYAFAPLSGREHDARSFRSPLLVVGLGALAASILGQSAVAAIAEAMGAITPAHEVHGKTIFQLNLLPHVITTIAAYIWTVATVVVHALCVSVLFDAARGVAPVETSARAPRARAWVIAGRLAASAVAVGALVATVYKIQQHLN